MSIQSQPQKKEVFMKRRFDPKKPRSIAGKAFQDKVLQEMLQHDIFENAEDFRDKKRAEGIAAGKPFTETELSILEKSWGDITFSVNGQEFFVECCFAMGETETSMCEIKRTRFLGDNKWYCYGKRTDPDTRVFIPSRVWHRYMERLELHKKNGWQFRTVPVHLIGENLRAAVIGVENFKKLFM